jgi:hypothetical protein
MSQNKEEPILKRAIQKIQREERANLRATRKPIVNPRLSTPARHSSPKPADSNNLSIQETHGIVNSSNLLEGPIITFNENPSSSLSIVTFEQGQTSTSSPITSSPVEYLFSQPKELNFENPVAEYLGENWSQQSQSIQERLEQ